MKTVNYTIVAYFYEIKKNIMAKTTPNKKSLGEEAVNSLIHTFFKQRTRAVVHPFRAPEKDEKNIKPFHIQVFDYDEENCDIRELQTVAECLPYKDTNNHHMAQP
jgi:hypothetical protein